LKGYNVPPCWYVALWVSDVVQYRFEVRVQKNKTISVAELQRELTRKLRAVSRTKEPLFVLNKDEVTAVVMSPDEYAALKDVEEVFEHLEIYEMVRERMKHYDPTQNISLEEIRRKKHAIDGKRPKSRIG
jgi:PHD/YefM family antitoxin component YafN of YafNO toxin-antitoxin module